MKTCNKQRKSYHFFTTLSLFILLFVSVNGAFAQNFTVSGNITDKTGESMIGVNIVIKGTTAGTVTDYMGNYTLQANANDTLLVSYIGYENQIIPVNGRTKIDIVLKSDLKSIDEVVVVGYGVQKKSDVTGSVASIKSEELEKMKAPTIDQAMQGRAAGVVVTTNSGTPGADMSIRVRGTGTINDSDPLYVVDGMPVDNMNFINPSDIESMEILKDAASCAIYGARGANGVIIITTKQGKEGQGQVSFDASFSLSQLYHKIDLANGSQYAMLRAEALSNAGSSVPPELEDYMSFGTGTDWQDEITRNAFTQNYNVSFRGGSERLSYFLSVNNINQEGIVLKTDYKRTALRLNTSYKAKEWLTVGENITIENRKTHEVSEGNDWDAVFIRAVNFEPTTAPRDSSGKYNGSKYTSTIANPIAQIDNTNNEATGFNIIGNIYAEFNIVKGLKFKSNYGVTHGYDRYWEFQPTYFVKTGDERGVNSLYESYSVGGTQNWTNYFTYTNTFGSNHYLNLLLGSEMYQENYKFMGATGVDLVSNNPDLATFDNLRNNQATPEGSYYQSRRASYMTRVSYSFKDKYLAQINYRIDGSSNFAKAHRYGHFPSFSLGWKMSEEQFLKDIAFLSNLKLRAGWGKVGNDRITPFAFYSVSRGGADYVINNENVGGTSFPQLVNNDIRWESTVTTNIAIDAAFFADKVSFTIDFYNKKTSDMLIKTELPGAVGAEEYPWTNQGRMDNKGFEVELGYKEMFGNWKFSVSGNFAYNKNEVTDLGIADYIVSADFQNVKMISRTEVGRPVASFYGYRAIGLFQNQAEVDAYVKPDGQPIQRYAKPGDIKYLADDDGNLVMDFIGSPLPDFTYGLNFKVDYRGFDFTMFLQGVYGNEVFNTTKYYTNNPSARYNLSADMIKRCMVDDAGNVVNNVNDPNLARLDVTDQQNGYLSDRFVEDGSYLRVKNLQLGYTLPQNLLSTLKIQNLRIFIGVTNLFTFTKYTGLDPEVGIGLDDNTGERNPLDIGIDRVKYPQPRTYMAGISLTF